MREELTARDNSMGNSGGTTDVIIMTQSSNSFIRGRFCSTPVRLVQGQDLACEEAKRTLDPDVSRSGNSENQQEKDKEETFVIVGSDAFGGEDHGPYQLPLGGSKPGTEHGG